MQRVALTLLIKTDGPPFYCSFRTADINEMHRGFYLIILHLKMGKRGGLKFDIEMFMLIVENHFIFWAIDGLNKCTL